jgi:hypothetical protein
MKVVNIGEPIEKALTSSSASARVLARLSISSAAEELADFINAELRRDGCDSVALLFSLWDFFIQTHACAAAQLVGDTGAKDLEGLVIGLVKAEYTAHFARVKASMAHGGTA